MRFIARYCGHHLWLALAATVLAVVGWTILFKPLVPSALGFGIKFGLAFSGPVNFVIIPLAYHLLPHRPDGAAILRAIGLIAGFAAPYLCVLIWQRYDMQGLIPYWRGDNIAGYLVLIPFLVFGALAGISCAKLFARFGDISSIFDVKAVMRIRQGLD